MSSGDLVLYQQLSSQLTALVDEFSNLVRAAGASDADDAAAPGGAGGGGGGAGPRGGADQRRQAPGELLEVMTEKLLAAAHRCVHTVSQLKRGAMLSDPASMIDAVRAARAGLDRQAHQSQAALASMRMEVQSVLNDLELHYYSSARRGPLPPPPRTELARICAHALSSEPDWGWQQQQQQQMQAAMQMQMQPPPPLQQQQQQQQQPSPPQ